VDDDMTDFTTVLFEKTPDKVATITLNRPEAMNAFNGAMCEEFQTIWRMITEDDEVNAVVIRAADGRAFSAGMDVWNPGNYLGSDKLWNKRDPGERLGPKHNRCWKPVIAAVHGMCAGGAFYWLNESDIVICSEEAQFFDPHVTYGLTSALEPIGLRWRVPLPEVLRMALMGNDERLSAATALRISLVTEIVPKDTLWARAHEIATMIAEKPSVATQGTVRAIWESLDATRTAGLNTALKYCLLGNEQGRKEAPRAELMKKPKKYRVR
jgi:enoyl-CoA hydratase/carnithine racemase